MIRTRWLAAALAGLVLSTACMSQPADRVFNLGVVYARVPMAEIRTSRYSRAFIDGLRDHGWVEGRNIRIHWRSAEQQLARLPTLIDELLSIPVDVLVVSGHAVAEEALARTRSVPIVTTALFRPTEYVASMQRPGGNLTGLAVEAAREIEGKRLALLKELAPAVTRVAFLNYGDLEPLRLETLDAARKLGMAVFHQNFDDPERIGTAIDEAGRKGANAIYVSESGPFALQEHQQRVHRAVERHRLPAVYWQQFSSDNGGLMTFSHDTVGHYRRAASYVDRILRGAKPGDLPIEQPVKYELVVNLKAARAIGLAVPRSVLVQADRVIE